MRIAAGFILGGMVGLAPLLLGFVLKQSGLGLVAFLFCTFLGFLTGLLGPVVAAVGFAVGIVASWHRARSGPNIKGG